MISNSEKKMQEKSKQLNLVKWHRPKGFQRIEREHKFVCLIVEHFELSFESEAFSVSFLGYDAHEYRLQTPSSGKVREAASQQAANDACVYKTVQMPIGAASPNGTLIRCRINSFGCSF